MGKDLVWWITFSLTLLCKDIFASCPSSDVPVTNITVVEGKTAMLPCSVESLGENKVMWRNKFSTLLTFQLRRIIADHRIVLERPYASDWNLLIFDVKEEDSGCYACQINTNPVKTKFVELNVLACNPGSYGKDCKEVCGHCEGKKPCNHINGSCLGSCEPGYKGEMCLTKCKSGNYGGGCNLTCGHCANNAICDHVSGACPDGNCAPGWTDLGDNKCDKACNDGWYGRECKQRCGYCRDDEPCHHLTGSCSGFCEPGYLGEKCDESEFSQLLAIQRKMLNSVRELLSFKRRKVGLIANGTSPTDLK